jgi:phenylacetate-CoA ligase
MIAMSDHYDRLENRSPAARESALFRDLRHILTVSKPRAAALRSQLKGIAPASLQSRADLASVPLLRKSDLLRLQSEAGALGNLTTTRLGKFKQAFLGAGALASAEGQAKDWWGVGRALFAAGLRKGDLVLNCFPYDLVPHGHMVASGAAAIGSAVIPAGAADLDAKVDAVARLQPQFFCGPAHHLKALLDRGADRDISMSCMERALVTGTTSAGLRNEFSLRGLAVRAAYMLPELGLVAYETGDTDGFTLNESLILEIVDPDTGVAVAPGTIGEMVVTRINADYPLLRYATGALSATMPQLSTCGRTNVRLRLPCERFSPAAHQAFVAAHAAHIEEIAKLHPTLGRMKLFMRRLREHDELHLKVERGDDETAGTEHVCETLRMVTRSRGTVEFVEPGTLSDDDIQVVDERSLN